MKRNEKILAGGLALVVAGYFGWPILHSIYLAPIEQLEGDLALAEDQVRDKEEKNFQLRLAAQRLSDSRRRGLPGDELEAQRLYQQWLTDLALTSGLNAKVTPNRRSPERGAYVAVEVTQLGQLLHGGWGYAEEYPISRNVVDALVLPIFEGVKPVLSLKVVARALLGA